MAENKTKPTEADVEAFLAGIADSGRHEDARAVCALMERVTGEPPRMWGPNMVGFGTYRYKYDSGREGEWLITGFSPRASALTLYIMGGFPRHQELMDRLGKHKTGKSCLYIKRLADVDASVLEDLVRDSCAYMRENHPTF